METVNISELRANLLKYLELANSGEQVSVTSNGRLLATISAPADKKEAAREKLGAIAKSVVIGDIVSSTGEDWEAQS